MNGNGLKNFLNIIMTKLAMNEYTYLIIIEQKKV